MGLTIASFDNLMAAVIWVYVVIMATSKFYALRKENSGLWGIFFTPAHYVVHCVWHVLTFGLSFGKIWIPLTVWSVVSLVATLYDVPQTQQAINVIFIGGWVLLTVLTAFRLGYLKITKQI